MEGIEEVGQNFADFKIPVAARVVGIGEATHGNREFQTVKRDVLEKVVTEGDGRCICFEMSVGDAAMLNDALHDKDADLIEAVGKQSYPIYDTEEIAGLLQWMREYNENLSYEESLMFYGVDIQGGYTAIRYLQETINAGSDLITEEEKSFILPLDIYDKEQYGGERDKFVAMSERLFSMDDLRCKQLGMVVRSVVLNIDAPDYEHFPQENDHNRDLRMAENLLDYSKIEEDRGYSQVVITAHSGHTRKGGKSVLPCEDDETMGDQIDRLFDGSYFCIGTDFYEGYVNIHTAGTFDENYERADHFYCSDDPLAYQAKYFENGIYCLDFSKVTDENSSIYKALHSFIFCGFAGEGYGAIQDLYKQERSKFVPVNRFDAMILYYEVTPIDPIHS
ncbi:erythromycin esterase family protein [Butyrivibrio sp. MC2013]|uniref:erythromycin esterase family protein n=1 Tax=Butyrivibrio sp. MC2013 TaxID=1280686 RepID=UPI00040EE2A6|nr:erythromycin esterase family protein [Butyrivibrio sp. MC2013]